MMHQWLWDLFPGGKERQFLYRREELQGAFRFFVLSQERPAESETFTIECRSFAQAKADRYVRLFLRGTWFLLAEPRPLIDGAFPKQPLLTI